MVLKDIIGIYGITSHIWYIEKHCRLEVHVPHNVFCLLLLLLLVHIQYHAQHVSTVTNSKRAIFSISITFSFAQQNRKCLNEK